MIKSFWLLFLIPVMLGVAGEVAAAQDDLRVEVFPKVTRQGNVYLLRASGPSVLTSIQGEFQGKTFSLDPAEKRGTYEALIGIDLSAKSAKYEMKVMATGESGVSFSKALRLKVEKTDFAVQKLSLPKAMVELDAKTQERVNQESKRVRNLFQGVREEKLWKGPFRRPLEGEPSGAFGARRVINGQARNPHSGIDLRAEAGTPVAACNSGTVALVEELFFSGKTVILDHGWGLYSMYFHLSDAGVRAGDRLRTGETLGRVGSTGRSTGPHLHWGMIIRGARVDPLSFLRLTEKLRE